MHETLRFDSQDITLVALLRGVERAGQEFDLVEIERLDLDWRGGDSAAVGHAVRVEGINAEMSGDFAIEDMGAEAIMRAALELDGLPEAVRRIAKADEIAIGSRDGLPFDGGVAVVIRMALHDRRRHGGWRSPGGRAEDPQIADGELAAARHGNAFDLEVSNLDRLIENDEVMRSDRRAERISR